MITDTKRSRARHGTAAAINGTKLCSACQRSLPVSMFGSNRQQRDGFQNMCKPCRHSYWNGWHAKRKSDPAYIRRLNNYQIKVGLNRALRKYKLTKADYDALVVKGCGVCGGGPNGRGRLNFDHDHKTDKFRGLLCSHCNTALGLFKDDPLLLERAKQYLKELVE